METVGDAMLRHPTVHPADLTVGEARRVFAERTKTHLLLLVRDGVLVATLDRGDLSPGLADEEPAAAHGALEGRTVGPLLRANELREEMADSGLRRIAVVDDDNRLLGLLCLKRSMTGFCTDEGVASMRDERTRS